MIRKFSCAALVAVLAIALGTGAALAHSQKSHSRSHKQSRKHHGKAHRLRLQQTTMQQSGTKLEGTIASADTNARTLSVTPEESNAPVTVDVPTSFDMSQFTVGKKVELLVSDNGDGTFTLVSVDDENVQGDDDAGQQTEP